VTTLFVDPCRIFCSFITTVASFLYSLSASSAMWSHHTNLVWSNRNALKQPIVEPRQVWRNNSIKDCAISSNGGKSSTEFGVKDCYDCSQFDRQSWCSNTLSCRRKEAISPDGKSMTLLFYSIAKMSLKWKKLAKDFDIPTTLTTNLKFKDKLISHFFLSELKRKHDTATGNPNHRILNSCQALALN